jgi:ATP-binding cassette subfamily F protein 3
LDEPTNHLDINAREALEEVLSEYNGTLLIVSHDRYFIDALATQIWSIRDQKMTTYLGNYTDYLEWLKRARERELEQAREQAKIQPGGVARTNPTIHAASNGAHNGSLKTISKEERQRQRKVTQLEQTIAQKEARLTAIGNELQTAGEKQDREALDRLSREYQQVTEEIEQLYNEWGVLAG